MNKESNIIPKLTNIVFSKINNIPSNKINNSYFKKFFSFNAIVLILFLIFSILFIINCKDSNNNPIPYSLSNIN